LIEIETFWIDLNGRFVHIRYFAVRDEQGEFMTRSLPITPYTRVAELLDAYPALEEFERDSASSMETPEKGQA